MKEKLMAEKEHKNVVIYPFELEVKQSQLFNVDAMVVEIMMYHCCNALL